MNKKSKEVIKEVIVDILKLRGEQYKRDHHAWNEFVYDESPDEVREVRVASRKKFTTEKFDIPLIKLNNLLKKEEQFDEILEIEKQMTKLQAKKYITVKEFTEIYGKSSDWQQNRRGRIHDRLPFRQDGHNKKITYVVSDVETWFENNNISR